MMNLKPNIQYICTKGSKDGTFQTGDKVMIFDNDIVNKTANGFMSIQDAGKAFIQAEFEPDYEWIKETKRRLNIQLAKLGEIE